MVSHARSIFASAGECPFLELLPDSAVLLLTFSDARLLLPFVFRETFLDEVVFNVIPYLASFSIRAVCLIRFAFEGAHARA